MSIDDSQIARLVVERKLCTANELELVRAEQRSLVDKGFTNRAIHELEAELRLAIGSPDGDHLVAVGQDRVGAERHRHAVDRLLVVEPRPPGLQDFGETLVDPFRTVRIAGEVSGSLRP